MSEVSDRGAGPEAERGGRLSAGVVLRYCVANLGYGAFFSFNNATLPLFMDTLTKNAVIQGLMSSTHSLEGAIIQPLVGTASDHLRTRWGRRRPFMMLFTPVSGLFLLLTPLWPRLFPNRASLALGAVVACVFLFTVLFNIAYDPCQALLPDITPAPQRGRVTSVWAFIGLVGQVLLVSLRTPPATKFSIVAGLMVLTTVFTCLTVRERGSGTLPVLGREERRSGHRWAATISALRGLRVLKQARLAMLMSFLAGLGIGAVLPFLTLFVLKITGCTKHQAEQSFLILLATTGLGVLPCGWLTDRIGAKPMLFVGFALVGAATLNGLWVSTLGQIAIVLAVAGLGNAAQSAASYPLLTQIVPPEEVGFYTGLQSTALSLAQPLTVVLTGVLINHGGYRYIFAVCSASILLALIVLSQLRMDLAAREISEREAQIQSQRQAIKNTD